MKRVLRWTARFLAVLIVLVGATAAYVYSSSNSKANRQYTVALQAVSIPDDSASVTHGQHLTTAVSKCVECHGDNLGGKVFIDDPGLGLVVAPNITHGEGGLLDSYSDEELVRVIRHGIKRDGRSTLIMPVEDYQYLTDEDVAAIVAYLHAAEPVDNSPGVSILRPVGRVLAAFDIAPLYTAATVDTSLHPPASILPDTSLEYGRYLANIGGCTGCHGPNLSGGPIPGMPPSAPPAANLTPTALSELTDADIEKMLRMGRKPDGTEIRPEMPWRYTAELTPLEMRATIKYLRSVPARDYGNR